MKTLIFRNEEKLSMDAVLEKFRGAVSTCSTFSQDEIELLAETYAKNPVDKFIVHEQLKGPAAQGDILFFAKGTTSYEKHVKTVSKLVRTDRLVLQEGDSLTGDHRLVPLEGSTYTLKRGKFKPEAIQNKSQWNMSPDWDCIMLSIDKPFLVFHREHGNLALPAGEYMVCTSLNPSSSSFNRMMD